ncbi:hypothetical protein AXK11_06495 [Cephaloticoccus primus]|uniref:Lipocalin-like domain-containing protein n=1 Tax=Cephaloticoccus primus TaxID=1548207 RepID=A0A139SLK0_9BACT|nr:TIGR03067 domain-containing protein [Cephaloticoccus primus]KXU35425.1 hypothetical protein AXK11_06495 [Cephaloticoccus primus]
MNEFGRQLQGTWALVRAELGGQPMPPEAAARVEIQFDAQGGYCVRFAGEITDAGRFTLTACAEGCDSPLQIALWGEIGTNTQRKLPGIVQLRGDRLRLCLALEGDAAPSEFSSKAGTAHYLVTYRRGTH